MVKEVRWQVASGTETAALSLTVQGTENVSLMVAVVREQRADLAELSDIKGAGTNKSQVTVAGRPGVMVDSGGPELRSLYWSPVDGVGATLDLTGRTTLKLVDLAERVRFDTASGCRVPLRLTALPPGARLTSCAVSLPPADTGRRPSGTLGVGTASGEVLIKEYGGPEPIATTSDMVRQVYDLGGFSVLLTGANRLVLASIAGGLRRAGDPEAPITWPLDPLGSG
jgi:hypothetical protein